MNINKNFVSQATSITMDLENLQQNYSNLLIKYKQAVADYINYLNTQSQKPYTQYSSSRNNIDYVSIKGNAYIGTGSAGQSKARTLQDCQAQCAKNSNCTGATFISNQCQIRIGDGQIITSSSNSYAIVPKSKQLLLNMENINQQLIATNKQIINKIKVGEPIYYKFKGKVDEKSEELKKSYKDLVSERENIRKLLDEYETLNSTDGENMIKINQNYYSYILLLIVAIVVIVLLIKISYPSSISIPMPELGDKKYYILLGVIILIVAVNIGVKHYFI